LADQPVGLALYDLLERVNDARIELAAYGLPGTAPDALRSLPTMPRFDDFQGPAGD
jgi:hypothetical protein